MACALLCGDNVCVINRLIPDASIDLVVTSPPYDDLRTYNGSPAWDFPGLAAALTRVLKPGGVIVWVVGDATKNGSETLTSMRQAIHFKDVCGLNVHDTMIYQKTGTGACGSNFAYWQNFEYMFVFSKGRPKAIHLIKDHANVRHGAVVQGGQLSRGGRRRTVVPAHSVRPNVWRIHPSEQDRIRHPARFPAALASAHIQSWSDEGDKVLDPFVGSGTTCIAARDLGRHSIGIDISEEYIALSRKRLGL